ncbi:MAG: exo-beta-N-acetylmuramidase NamZ family protein [Bacteroidales bacterium]
MKKTPAGLCFGWILLLLLWTQQVDGQLKLGIEVLEENGFDLLQGKRVGLVTNPTGVDSRLRSTIDILYGNVNLTLLFAPEHGVRGEFSAGDHVGDQVDERTGIPVVSLYGSSRKPDPEALQKLDVIVYDIQDLGVRSYTYISTMGLVMEAAAEQGKEVVILDRPNPLGGLRVEGPLVEEGFHSFVSQYSIPYVYGLTCGELARYLNEEGLLAGRIRCDLHVVPMEGWDRSMTFDRTGLQWVPTSPHIPDLGAAYGYPATGIIGELDGGMIGIGYTLPFQVLVTESVDAIRLADAMNGLGLEGVVFRPVYLRPYYSSRQGENLQGVQLHFTDPAAVPLTEIQFWFLQEAHKLDPAFDPFQGREGRYRMFDQVCGSDRIRTSLMKDFDFSKLLEFWTGEADSFRARSARYYLYK